MQLVKRSTRPQRFSISDMVDRMPIAHSTASVNNVLLMHQQRTCVNNRHTLQAQFRCSELWFEQPIKLGRVLCVIFNLNATPKWKVQLPIYLVRVQGKLEEGMRMGSSCTVGFYKHDPSLPAPRCHIYPAYIRHDHW